MNKKKLVIFSGSNKHIQDEDLKNNLDFIGKNLNTEKFEIWYGGGNSGLIDIIPKEFYNNKGNVYSIDAKQFVSDNDEIFGERYIMDTFNDRQEKLINSTDLYLCLPGGVGTMSELFEVLVNNDVNSKNLAIILYSYNGFYDDIINFIVENVREGYIKEKILSNIFFYKDHEDIVKLLNSS